MSVAVETVTKPLSLRGVSHRYGAGVIALSAVSFDVDQGTFTLILGPNGAGKTTLANIMGGMLRPMTGEVRVWERPARYREARAFNREGIALVPERRRLFNRLTVRENIVLGAYALREPRRELEERMRSMLKHFPSAISQRLDVPAGSLSGGEQQLLAVARALIAKPKLIILDEPSLGLAPRAIESVYDLLASARQEGTTLVVIEQSGAVALDYASHIVILDRGREIFRGAADSITQERILEIGYVGHAEPVEPDKEN